MSTLTEQSPDTQLKNETPFETGNEARRLLVIGANAETQEFFREVFQSSEPHAGPDRPEDVSYHLDLTSSGQEGWERARNLAACGQSYALAFVDAETPGPWNGLEATAKILETDSDLQVVLCAGANGCDVAEIVRRVGRSDRFIVIRKPLNGPEIKQVAGALVEKRELFRNYRDSKNRLREIEFGQGVTDKISRQTLDKTAERRLEAIGRLAAGIAHEINTPAQYVGDNTRFLKDAFAEMEKILRSHQEILAAAQTDRLTADTVAQAKEIVTGADLDYLFKQVPSAIAETLEGVDRMTTMVRAMREFSHAAGRVKVEANLNTAIESTVTVTRNEWKYVADMKLDLDPKLPHIPVFLGDFNQVILHLIINAADAIADVVRHHPGKKGRITITTRKNAKAIEIRVADTGTGIPENIRSRIFEPTFTTKAAGRGTGQGLSIVDESVVKKHGGTVTFETEMGRGTTFIIRLPMAPCP